MANNQVRNDEKVIAHISKDFQHEMVNYVLERMAGNGPLDSITTLDPAKTFILGSLAARRIDKKKFS
ncbi:MAG: hypothetical protein FP824_10975 [Euryarchaeota archaeon]|nr:hypothetical protein [Euryarchaeota archaeon]